MSYRPGDSDAVAEDQYDFSVVLGGPLYQLVRRAHLSGAALELLHRRVIVLSLLGWLPLLILSVMSGRAWGDVVRVPFLVDVEVHARFLLALPLLIVAALVVHQRMRLVVAAFVKRGLVPDSARGKFDAAVAAAMRLRNSVLAEVLLFAFVSQWHVRAPTKEEFSSFLLDLYGSLLRGFEKPKRFIHMMDAITGLEGEGPGVSGRPRSIRAILIGEDAVAVDCTAVHLVGLAAKEARTIALGAERGLGEGSLAKIDLRGERLDGFFRGHYVPSSLGDHDPDSRWPMNTKLVKNLLIERPVPSGKKCTLCYHCKTICPGGAIQASQNTGVPFYNYDRCIRCYCCMEICPEAAISLKRGKLQWVLDGSMSTWMHSNTAGGARLDRGQARVPGRGLA